MHEEDEYVKIWLDLRELALGDSESGPAKIVINENDPYSVILEWNDGSFTFLIFKDEYDKWVLLQEYYTDSATQSGMYD